MARSTLSAADLLAGSALVHDVAVPVEILEPRGGSTGAPRFVRLRPLTVGAMAVISRASRDDPSLTPLLMIKEALVEPAVSLDQVRTMHVGLVHFLVGEINEISGLGPDGEARDALLQSPSTRAHLLLAKHFGWTPDQVAQLSPAQVMVYLAGIERLLEFDESRDGGGG